MAALLEIGQVAVGKGDRLALHLPLRTGDVGRRDLVAHTPRSGVQEDPHPVPLVNGHLDEVVAGSERPELQRPVARVPRRVESGPRGQLGQVRDPRGGGLLDLPVVAPRRQRDPPRDGGVQLLQAADRQVGEREPGPHRLHPAADVHAHCGRHDGAVRRDHAADGRALSEVRVRHEGQVRLHERHRRGRLGLPARAVLQQRRPAVQLRPQPLHSSSSLPRMRSRCGAVWVSPSTAGKRVPADRRRSRYAPPHALRTLRAPGLAARPRRHRPRGAVGGRCATSPGTRTRGRGSRCGSTTTSTPCRSPPTRPATRRGR